eukprot:COSAG02_NODE_6200_length_3733_cov_3.467125_6_plen_47_part_00
MRVSRCAAGAAAELELLVTLRHWEEAGGTVRDDSGGTLAVHTVGWR